MAYAMNISDSETDSDATYCEEAENGDIYVKLDKIQCRIRSHHLRQVFMTKPQMRGYREYLIKILPHVDTQTQRLVNTFLEHLEQLTKIVEEFERKWSSQQSLAQASDDFPCSLLTNQDFVSQEQPSVHEETVKPIEIDENTQIVQQTESPEHQTQNDEKKIFEANVAKTTEMMRQFKINFYEDLITARQNPMPSVNSTTTSLVPDEFKLSPTTDAMNRATVFQIQMEANKWTMFSENKN